MSRRLILGISVTAVSAALAVGGSVAHAANDSEREKLCINVGGDGRLLPPQYCVTWIEPTQPAS